jgi:hypothetical protein
MYIHTVKDFWLTNHLHELLFVCDCNHRLLHHRSGAAWTFPGPWLCRCKSQAQARQGLWLWLDNTRHQIFFCCHYQFSHRRRWASPIFEMATHALTMTGGHQLDFGSWHITGSTLDVSWLLKNLLQQMGIQKMPTAFFPSNYFCMAGHDMKLIEWSCLPLLLTIINHHQPSLTLINNNNH